MKKEILDNLKTPCYICYEELLENNLKILENIKQNTNIDILLALKGFAYPPLFGLISKYLDGACASGLYEARLSYNNIKKQTHTYSPAYSEYDIKEIAKITNHLVFNSSNQLYKYKDIVKQINPNISLSLRINPQISFAPKDLYNPCAKYSRFGITKKNFNKEDLQYIDGLHFHTLCEEDSFALEKVLERVEIDFSQYFDDIKYINLGGGHHITKVGYDTNHLISIINNFQDKYPHIKIILELGESIGWQCGVLVSSILDIVENDINIAILDTSAEAHMPDVLAMPYRPDIKNTSIKDIKKYTYRLGGNTCLSGDIIGDYSFDKPLKIGDKIIFEDMMHYSYVKNTTFNGIRLPSIGYIDKQDKLHITKEYGYDDYKNRLG
jgi:carboxynorspermidine decarboxylase